MKNVEEFRRRIIRVVWPRKLPELEDSLKTLSINLVMALGTFVRHSRREGDDEWVREVTRKRPERFGNPTYQFLLAWVPYGHAVEMPLHARSIWRSPLDVGREVPCQL